MSHSGLKAADLQLTDLLDFEPNGGVLRFAGERILLLDAVALGLLRKHLLETFGLNAARAMLTRFGYSHGWRTADTLRHAVDWADEREWRIAGGRLHRLQGLVTFEPVDPSRRPDPPPFADAVWRDSYEAEQHLLHLGQADEPVCWTLTGFASGYLSRVTGRAIYCIEETCRGQGDACCAMVGRELEAWGDQIKPHLPYYEGDCLDDTLRHVQSALKKAESQLRKARAKIGGAGLELVGGLLFRSDVMRRVVEIAKRVAATDATVLIQGESGVGKEIVARFLHDASPRTNGPFVALNCAAIPESLIESELFGYVKGAFSGAHTDRAGLFEAAQGGTVFLDEIGELPLNMQARLLRVLQEREVRRLGENRTRKLEVRVLAATLRDLGREVAAGRFREDLFYRLKVIELRVPPLRERPDDILPLAEYFLARTSERDHLRARPLSQAAARLLLAYPWPGNVRELEYKMERALILADGAHIEPEDLTLDPSTMPRPAAGPTSLRSLAEVEREHILAILEACDGNRTRAAEVLGIGTATLFRKLKEYQVTRTEGR